MAQREASPEVSGETSNVLMSSSPTDFQIPLRLPAVFLRFWGNALGSDLRDPTEALLSLPGIFRVAENTLAVLPITADPGEIELGLTLARQIHTRSALGALVIPGLVDISLEGVTAVIEPLLERLVEAPVQLPVNRIYLTGYAAGRLRGEWPLEPIAGAVPGVRIYGIKGPGFNFRPWHNPRLLMRITEHVGRPDTEQALLNHREAPILKVKGPIGSGKSRLVWRTLGPPELPEPSDDTRSMAAAWISIPGARFGGPGPAHQLLQRLARLVGRSHGGGDPAQGLQHLGLEQHEGWVLGTDRRPDDEELRSFAVSAVAAAHRELGEPVRLIFDDLHTAGQHQLADLSRLIHALNTGEDCRVVLINRFGHPWPEGVGAAPEVPVPPMTARQLARLSSRLTQGLALPLAVEQRLQAASGGSPLALEEALIKMIHLKQLRQIYGSFFFNGDGEAGYEPSDRWIQLLEAEARALGNADGMRVLASAGIPLPLSELSSATSLLGVKLTPRWEEPFLDAGWVTRTMSEWGPGLAPSCAAFKDGMAATLAASAEPIVRRTVGEILSHTSDQPKARWQAYNLLSGTAAAVPPILELAREHDNEADSERLLDGLQREVQAHRQRGGDPATEIQMLWTLLPLARRAHRLEDFSEEMDRALEISALQPRKLLAFASLKTELDLQRGRFKEGEKTLRGALELVVDEDPGRQALLLLQLSRLLIRQARYREARALLEQLLPVLESRQAQAQIASCKFHLGNIALHQNQLEEAFEFHKQALEERHRDDNQKSLGSSLSALGAVSIAKGNYAKALSFYNKAEAVLEEHGDIGEVSFALMGRGRVLRRLGDYAGGARDLRMALTLRSSNADRIGEAIPRLLLAKNQLDIGKHQDALTEARLASFDLRLGPEVSQLGDAEQLLGRIHLQAKQTSRAKSHLEAALEIHRRQEDATGALWDLSWLLKLAMMEKRGEEALDLCRQIEAEREALKPSERRESLDFYLYEGFSWLDAQAIEHEGEPLACLQRAFDELMRKAEMLDTELRHRYLFQVPENAAILESASAHHIEIPT